MFCSSIYLQLRSQVHQGAIRYWGRLQVRFPPLPLGKLLLTLSVDRFQSAKITKNMPFVCVSVFACVFKFLSTVEIAIAAEKLKK